MTVVDFTCFILMLLVPALILENAFSSSCMAGIGIGMLNDKIRAAPAERLRKAASFQKYMAVLGLLHVAYFNTMLLYETWGQISLLVWAFILTICSVRSSLAVKALNTIVLATPARE